MIVEEEGGLVRYELVFVTLRIPYPTASFDITIDEGYLPLISTENEAYLLDFRK
jgi:hypothetical protein